MSGGAGGWVSRPVPRPHLSSAPAARTLHSHDPLLPAPAPGVHCNCGDVRYSEYVDTGCPRKNALLCSKAYKSSLEAAIGTSRDNFCQAQV